MMISERNRIAGRFYKNNSLRKALTPLTDISIMKCGEEEGWCSIVAPVWFAASERGGFLMS